MVLLSLFFVPAAIASTEIITGGLRACEQSLGRSSLYHVLASVPPPGYRRREPTAREIADDRAAKDVASIFTLDHKIVSLGLVHSARASDSYALIFLATGYMLPPPPPPKYAPEWARATPALHFGRVSKFEDSWTSSGWRLLRKNAVRATAGSLHGSERRAWVERWVDQTWSVAEHLSKLRKVHSFRRSGQRPFHRTLEPASRSLFGPAAFVSAQTLHHVMPEDEKWETISSLSSQLSQICRPEIRQRVIELLSDNLTEILKDRERLYQSLARANHSSDVYIIVKRWKAEARYEWLRAERGAITEPDRALPPRAASPVPRGLDAPGETSAGEDLEVVTSFVARQSARATESPHSFAGQWASLAEGGRILNHILLELAERKGSEPDFASWREAYAGTLPSLRELGGLLQAAREDLIRADQPLGRGEDALIALAGWLTDFTGSVRDRSPTPERVADLSVPERTSLSSLIARLPQTEQLLRSSLASVRNYRQLIQDHLAVIANLELLIGATLEEELRPESPTDAGAERVGRRALKAALDQLGKVPREP